MPTLEGWTTRSEWPTSFVLELSSSEEYYLESAQCQSATPMRILFEQRIARQAGIKFVPVSREGDKITGTISIREDAWEAVMGILYSIQEGELDDQMGGAVMKVTLLCAGRVPGFL